MELAGATRSSSQRKIAAKRMLEPNSERHRERAERDQGEFKRERFNLDPKHIFMGVRERERERESEKEKEKGLRTQRS